MIRTLRCLGALAILLACSCPLLAQVTSTAPLSGTISDTTGAVVPAAQVQVRNQATGATFKTETNANGTFIVPALPTGEYTVTVTMSGFKQAVVNNVKIDVGVPKDIAVTLEVGTQSEVISVEGTAAVLQTQTATVSTTLTGRQIVDLPLVSRDSLDLVLFLPGVTTPGRPRSSFVDGLPQNAMNITLDGLNVQDNLSKSTDGYFTYIRPRLDAIGEVTVSTAAGGADSGGEGSVQVKFVTRSGTNDYKGSVYYYHRNTALNTNYWYNNRDLAPDSRTGKAPRTPANLHQYGFRIGGPIIFPKLFDGRNRAFFFMNYEEFRLPEAALRQPTILSQEAQRGEFRYVSGGATQTVNLLTLAASRGMTSTIDPTIGALLAQIRGTTSQGSVAPLTDPNLERFTFTNKGGQWRKFPTVRLDFNLSSKHSLETTFNYQDFAGLVDFLNSTDPRFPGFPNSGSQGSNRKSGTVALRSTLTPRLVNEFRIGMTGGTTLFFPEVNSAQFANQAGFNLAIGSAAAGITSATASTGPSRRHTPVTQINETLSASMGKHNLNMGGNFTRVRSWNQGQTVVPTINFGINGQFDPAEAMFTTANFPGASTTNLNNARSLYAVLTGRVTSINATAILDEKTGKYTYLGKDVDRVRQHQMGMFVQDAWRVKQNLTLNMGLRWDILFPYVAMNNRYAKAEGGYAALFGESGEGNIYKPGTLTGTPTRYLAVQPGEKLFNTNWLNLAPSGGFAWTPKGRPRFLSKLMGEPGGFVIRAGVSVNYTREGISDGDDLRANPGGSVVANRDASLGNLVNAGESWPLLLRDRSRLGPPAFQEAPTFPFLGAVTNGVTVIDENLKMPRVVSWNFSIQRELNRSTVLEVRYNGNYFNNDVVTRGLNETNIVENGMLEEFRLAQANLRANVAAGRGATFAYRGPGTGTNPLPNTLAYFSGIDRARAGDASLYTSPNFTSTTFVNPLIFTNPAPYSYVGALDDDATRRANALRAGLPANFILVNPGKLGGANYLTNYGFSNYNAGSVELRRRFDQGLQLSFNYTFSKAYESIDRGFRVGQERSLSNFAITHVAKVNWLWDLPIGRGKWIAGNSNGFLNQFIGGWSIYGTGRVQSGQPLNLGDVRLVGMTRAELQKEIGVRKGGRDVFWLPEDIILNTQRAFSVSATTPNGYGTALGPPTGRYIAPGNGPDCIAIVTGGCGGTQHVIYGPRFIRFDISAVKKFNVNERVNIEFRGEFLNAFNNINFYIGSVTANQTDLGGFSGQTFGQITQAYRDTSTTNDPGGRLAQLVLRINF